jgi:thiamine kinase-like enzyme
LAREIAVAQFLVARGVGVVPPSSEMPPGPHEADGFAVSFWQFIAHYPDQLPAAVEVGQSLAALHRVLRDFPDALPYLASPLGEVPRWLDGLERAGALAPADLALLRGVYERVAAVLRTPGGPVQALHGDAHTRNVLVTAEGLLWTDFEDTCCGPLAWDLACFARTAPWGAAAALASYDDAPSQEALQPYIDARFLQVTVWYAVLACRFPEFQAQTNAALRHWREHA